MVNVEVIVQELDRLYEFEIDKYVGECDQLKRMGYRIYRNDSGKHKVVAPQSNKTTLFGNFDGDSLFSDLFGGVFK